MKKQIFAAMATALVILPLGVKAAQNDFQNNSDRILSVTSNQIAQNHFSGDKRRGKGERMEKLLQQLDLTSEQSQKIQAIREESQTEKEALYQEMKTNHEQMRSLFSSNADSEQLRQQHQKNQDLYQQIGNNRFEMMLQVREVLTLEQRNQISELMTQHRGRRGHRNE